MGLSLMEHALVSEALGRTPLGHFVFWCQAPDVGNIELLEMFANEEQKKTFLHPLVKGDIRSCFSMTEVDLAGSNPVMMDTTAVKDGDDYVINGQKWYTSSADGANFAIVMAKTNPEAAPYLQASMIIVPCDTPGFNLVRNIPVMGHSGEGYFSHGGNSLPELPGAPDQPARPGRPRLCPGPGTARAGTDSSLHALDRHLQPGL